MTCQLKIGPDSVAANRIFCIGKNYAGHVRELSGTVPEDPVIFMKPVSCLVPEGEPVRLPSHGTVVHHEVEVVLLIGKEGRDISQHGACSHIAGVTLGIDLTLRDVQSHLKKHGLPWELSKAFEQSAPIGQIVPAEKLPDLANIAFRLEVNGDLRQEGSTADMIFSVPEIIQYLSRVWELAPGDLIFTGTPAGVGPLHAGDAVTIQSEFIGTFTWEFM